jgi:hypothetical protein
MEKTLSTTWIIDQEKAALLLSRKGSRLCRKKTIVAVITNIPRTLIYDTILQSGVVEVKDARAAAGLSLAVQPGGELNVLVSN